MITSEPFREALVTELVNEGVLHSSSVLHAFLKTPREVFVPAYYKEWKTLVTAEETPEEEYLEAVYQNDSLVTKINEKGHPISSSSLPSVMAIMLESLDVHPGHRVLEIGTGTGYNAALLCELTGDPKLVTSIEYDSELAHQANSRIAHVCPGVSILVRDGIHGDETHAPYDRIIATASAPIVPASWLAQLAPGGRIVMDLQGSLQASGFLVIEKTMSSEIVGCVKERPLYFMPMMEAPGATTITTPLIREWTTTESEPFPTCFDIPSFRWWLQWAQAGCRIRRQSQRRNDGSTAHFLFVIFPDGSGVRFQPIGKEWKIKVYGEQIWQTLARTYEDFAIAGTPAPDEYRLIVEEHQPSLTVGAYRFPV
jgi:protein-L-isoaspartate(D-aspartate) O-methyltransferase